MKWIWIILALLYVLSRIDLIPDVLVGWGWVAAGSSPATATEVISRLAIIAMGAMQPSLVIGTLLVANIGIVGHN